MPQVEPNITFTYVLSKASFIKLSNVSLNCVNDPYSGSLEINTREQGVGGQSVVFIES